VVEVLSSTRALPGREAERAFHRDLGDHTLFMLDAPEGHG
jgi:hypothetical protein